MHRRQAVEKKMTNTFQHDTRNILRWKVKFAILLIISAKTYNETTYNILFQKRKHREIYLYHTRHKKWMGEYSSIAVWLKLLSHIPSCYLCSRIWSCCTYLKIASVVYGPIRELLQGRSGWLAYVPHLCLALPPSEKPLRFLRIKT
jgi:hypothetical protein